MKGSVRLAKKMARSASLAPEESFIRNCTYLDHSQKMSLYTAEIRISASSVRSRIASLFRVRNGA